ncbi:GNAT family N-acetyltransferase [Inconstantimicrobium mannanitabidum]|uniref:Uncharacterized protein n=1 Tax=Inconstantimicrobium mannanitabidum TaxID=1604901 RepID=A0ACB5RBA3_9CLOT|nr:GNAT family N-acetyltransferase [Clostridium sp. TW13]GKX66502.1 hypothetical protein rsdtw13_17600 [Clostridium sp. TW13]
MQVKIINPNEDQYGNSKENIFIAFDDKENYLGSAYAYPNVNYHQTQDTPYLIFIDVNILENMDNSLGDEVKKKLFDNVFSRAKELRLEKPELKARIYAGFENNSVKNEFYIKNGFEEDYTIIMETEIPKDFSYTVPENITIEEMNFSINEEFEKYKSMYDEIFVSPLDKEQYEEQRKHNYFRNIAFYIDGKLQGGCTVFEKDGFGYIETVFVLSEQRGKGLSKEIMKYIFNYFLSNGLNKSRLEVWLLNKRAVRLYESFGYIEVEKKLMFPGITL